MKGSVLYLLVFVGEGEELLVAAGVTVGIEVILVAMGLYGKETVDLLLTMAVVAVVLAGETTVGTYGEVGAEDIGDTETLGDGTYPLIDTGADDIDMMTVGEVLTEGGEGFFIEN